MPLRMRMNSRCFFVFIIVVNLIVISLYMLTASSFEEERKISLKYIQQNAKSAKGKKFSVAIRYLQYNLCRIILQRKVISN